MTRVQILQKNIQQIADQITETELRRRAENVLREAQSLAPRSGTRSFTDGIKDRRAGGRLADSLEIYTTTDKGKKVIRIRTTAKNSRGQEYGRFVIRGTGAHAITGNPNLKFQWINRNVFVITPQVQHPGTQPNNFLLTALRSAFTR